MVARGDDSIRVQVETDIAAVLDAYTAVGDLWDLSLTLARRRWRTADGERFQADLLRIEMVLGMVHRWLARLRNHPLGLEIMREGKAKEPSKEDSASTD